MARCGAEKISADAVVSVMSKRHEGRDRALEQLRFDCAVSQGPLGARGWALQSAERMVLAHAMLMKLREAPEPPITSEELAQMRAEHADFFDHDEASVTTHAVALVAPGHPEQDAKAHALAEAVWQAEQGVTSNEDFQARAGAVPRDGIELRVESLPPVTATGEAVTVPPQQLDLTFALAANQIPAIGGVSPVVHSAFGYHVIYLVNRIPAAHPTDEELRRIAGEEIITKRHAMELATLLGQLHQKTHVSMERSLEDTMALLGPAPAATEGTP